jgi:hypothetical protein
MAWWSRSVVAGLAGLATVVACGGKSGHERDGSAEFGGAAGSARGGVGGVDEGVPRGCSYNGVQYAPGQTFGACNACTCDADAGVYCLQPACASGGGVGGTASVAGAAGRTSGAGGTAGTIVGGSSGTGGTAPLGGAGSAGSSGRAGAGASCDYVDVDSFCVVGSPSGDGQDLVEGMPLIVSRRPQGCHSSSCTRVGESDCNVIGSDGKYWVSGSVCLLEQGGACTADCGGGNSQCDLGPLKAGEYTIGLGGIASPSVTFKVPSHVKHADLCASTSAP